MTVMTVQSPYLQIKGHQIELDTQANRRYSDEFRHVITYFYKAAHSDPRYDNIQKTVAGKKFLRALFRLDVVPNWTIFGGTFVKCSDEGVFPLSNTRAIDLLTQQFQHQQTIMNWIGIGYGFLRKVIFVNSHSDFRSSPSGTKELNPDTPIFPPTSYVIGSSTQSCTDPIRSRKLYNSKRVSIDKRKFQSTNNHYVNGALYGHIPSTCAKIVPDSFSNSRIVLKVLHDDKSWSYIVITKYHEERVQKLNHLAVPFHDAFKAMSTGKFKTCETFN